MPQQFNPELKAYINGIMPDIDEAFNTQNIPIHDRYMKAAILFVEHFIESSSFETNDELMRDKAFFEGVVPLFMQWFHEKYGELARPPQQRSAKGIITSYAQPIKISIPLTTSEATNNGTSWIRFPDKIDKNESIESFFDKKVPLNILNENQYSTLKEEVSGLVSIIRAINLNLMAAENLDVETTSMMGGIWSHFEKAVDDIISFRSERVSVGCWELHLAIEKSFKVLIKQKTNKKEIGHNLISLHKKAKSFCPELDLTLLESLPTDKDAIKLRYAEQSRNIQDALVFYKNALQIVLCLTNKLARKYSLNNAGFEIKKSPWAI